LVAVKRREKGGKLQREKTVRSENDSAADNGRNTEGKQAKWCSDKPHGSRFSEKAWPARFVPVVPVVDIFDSPLSKSQPRVIFDFLAYCLPHIIGEMLWLRVRSGTN
jgi:hypothetical protein